MRKGAPICHRSLSSACIGKLLLALCCVAGRVRGRESAVHILSTKATQPLPPNNVIVIGQLMNLKSLLLLLSMTIVRHIRLGTTPREIQQHQQARRLCRFCAAHCAGAVCCVAPASFSSHSMHFARSASNVVQWHRLHCGRYNATSPCYASPAKAKIFKGITPPRIHERSKICFSDFRPSLPTCSL